MLMCRLGKTGESYKGMMTPFNVGVKAVIERDGKVLIVRGGSDRDFWECPGGRIDGDETVEQALRRELEEELPGITNINIGRILHALRVPGMVLGDKGLFLVWYHVRADFPKGVQLSDEHRAYRWCNQDEVHELALEGTRRAVDALIEGGGA